MQFIEIDNGKITRICCGPKRYDESLDFAIVPEDFQGEVGQSIEEFDSEWNMLPLSVRFEKGFIPNSNKYKLVGENLVKKTQIELIIDGIEQVPQGMKIMYIDGKPQLIPMSPDDLADDGLMTREEATRLNLEEEKSELKLYLSNTDWYVTRWMEREIAIPIDVKSKRLDAIERINKIDSMLIL